VAVWVCWRRGPQDTAIAVLLIATCLATPHAFVYDLPLLTAAVALLVSQRLNEHRAFAPLELIVLLLAVIFPAIMAGAQQHLPLGGVALVLFLTLAVRNHTTPSARVQA
jgi:uncharacterized membrane protein YfhO